MQHRFARAFGGALLSALTLAVAAAQIRDMTIEGQITPFNFPPNAGISVELTSQAGTGRQRTYVDGTGEFRFSGVPAGEYDLRVTSSSGDVLYQSAVTVRDDFNRLNIKLRDSVQQPRATAGTVSLADLQHKVPGKALKEFRKSEELIAKGRLEDAVARLQTAVAADPAFARAYGNLAACEAGLKHFDKAAEYGRKAVQLDPGLAPAQMNLSHILLIVHEYAEAETAARAALKLSGESGKARYFLGLALHGQRRFGEALEQFTRAGDSIPAARLHAAELLARNGRNADAAGQLRAYLDLPDAPNRDAVQQWLDHLDK